MSKKEITKEVDENLLPSEQTKQKTKKEHLIIEIPEGLEVNINEETNEVKIKSKKGEIAKKFRAGVRVTKKDEKTIQIIRSSNRREVKALSGTTQAEIKNMIKGLTKGIVYKLKLVYSHFPITLKVQGTDMVIDNFLGEKYPRRAKILEGVEVIIKGQDLEVTGINKENVGQTAANIEQATKIKNRDPRVFQDGIYIYEKDGKSLL